MKDITDVYLVGVHRYCFRAGEPAKVIGVKSATVLKDKQRFCYVIRFDDDIVDYVPFVDVHINHNWVFTTMKEIKENGLPKVDK